jgi:hypothetical protein
MKKLTEKEFISKSKSIHRNKYNYSQTKYVDSYSNVTIECPIHGIFSQRANHHLQGHGCPYCTIKVTTEMFIKNATKIHGNKYDYSLVKYTNKNGKVKIICKYHGTFVQLAKNHLRGQCCPRCKNYVSKPEIDFLNLVKIPQKNRQIYIGKYKVDGVNGKSIFEFLGDYWHGNPNKFDPTDVNKSCGMTYGKLLDRTMHKFKNLKEMGYKINYIWESDWKRYLQCKSLQLKKY